MKLERTVGIVLRRTDYGEGDRILQIITPLGKRGVMARGVRKPKSKLAGGVELLAESEIVLRQGKGELYTLSSARMNTYYRSILASYDRLQFAYEVLRLVAKASEYVDSEEWYTITKESLAALDVPSINLALIKSWFYLRYSQMLGEELNTRRDASGQPLRADSRYQYSSSDHALLPLEQGDIGVEHIKILRVLQTQPLRVAQQVGGVELYLAVVLGTVQSHVAHMV